LWFTGFRIRTYRGVYGYRVTSREFSNRFTGLSTDQLYEQFTDQSTGR